MATVTCSVCSSSQPKYKCPSCDARTCSLPCVRRHKDEQSCDGKRGSKTKFVKLSQLNETHLWNDLALLERVTQEAEASKRQHDRLGDKPEGVSIRRFKQAKKDAHALTEACKAQGIEFVRAPLSMSRSKRNRSKALEQGVEWMVEWTRLDPSTGAWTVFEESLCKDSEVLVLPASIADAVKARSDASTVDEAEISLEEDTPSSSRRAELRLLQRDGTVSFDPTKTLGENLTGRRIDEYPTIRVVYDD